MLRPYALILLGTLAVGGCRFITGAVDPVEVRMRNATSLELTAIRFSSPGGSLEVSRLSPGEASAYVRQDCAYPYGSLTVVANGVERRIQPFDYVGASPLGPGRYSYAILTSTVLQGGFDLTLERDR
jgi:hypothetical protein